MESELDRKMFKELSRIEDGLEMTEGWIRIENG